MLLLSLCGASVAAKAMKQELIIVVSHVVRIIAAVVFIFTGQSHLSIYLDHLVDLTSCQYPKSPTDTTAPYNVPSKALKVFSTVPSVLYIFTVEGFFDDGPSPAIISATPSLSISADATLSPYPFELSVIIRPNSVPLPLNALIMLEPPFGSGPLLTILSLMPSPLISPVVTFAP